MKTLNSVKAGKQATVKSIKGTGSTRRRIMDMGIIKGETIKVVKRAPFGDPIEFKVKGYNLTLRKSEAKLIEVESGDD